MQQALQQQKYLAMQLQRQQKIRDERARRKAASGAADEAPRRRPVPKRAAEGKKRRVISLVDDQAGPRGREEYSFVPIPRKEAPAVPRSSAPALRPLPAEGRAGKVDPTKGWKPFPSAKRPRPGSVDSLTVNAKGRLEFTKVAAPGSASGSGSASAPAKLKAEAAAGPTISLQEEFGDRIPGFAPQETKKRKVQRVERRRPTVNIVAKKRSGSPSSLPLRIAKVSINDFFRDLLAWNLLRSIAEGAIARDSALPRSRPSSRSSSPDPASGAAAAASAAAAPAPGAAQVPRIQRKARAPKELSAGIRAGVRVPVRFESHQEYVDTWSNLCVQEIKAEVLSSLQERSKELLAPAKVFRALNVSQIAGRDERLAASLRGHDGQ